MKDPTDLWKDYFDLLLEFEGTVYECDPDDPGGATKFGIDQRSHPAVDIRALTKAGAEAIYLAEYRKSAARLLPSPLSFSYFDLRVNAGEERAAKTLQRAIGIIDDGVAGPKTLASVQAIIANGEAGKLLLRFTAERERFYKNLAHANSRMGKFLGGWLARAKTMHQWAAARLGEGGVA